MNVKSKYNLGDTVWYMSNNHAQSGIVNGVFFHVTHKKKEKRTYVEYSTWHDGSKLPEVALFPSKNELLNTL